MPNLINIPDDVSCIHPYVLTGAITVASGIIFYLVKVIKEKEKNYKTAVLNHITDLKEEHQIKFDVSDKQITFVLQTLENQITKLK